ncbi:DNA-3-methyladenine glycosylase I [Candidatus Woesearchaeota archaeon]|nr:DNA-3-methyladenine glycosylase I [Candidatus Woesearchaeota archaeon]
MAKIITSYCASVRHLPKTNVHRQHHDTEHGRTPKNDDDLFRRLMLEISQAGLSFETVLKKKKSIYEAFATIEKVARYTKKDIKQLMKNPGIIRNRLKIESAIFNAQKIKEIQKEHKTFLNWLRKQDLHTREEWTKVFKKTFKFTGGEIVNEFLMSINILPGAHEKYCVFLRKEEKDSSVSLR